MRAAPARLPAPAKINLFLHVVGRRADGYHELQTVFQFLDLADEVRLAVRGDGVVRRARALPGVPEEADLAVRAARLLQARSGCRLGVDLAVRKRIPAGGGLGGGSSDAASTLVGLARLWELDLDLDALAALGLELGADVPVFVHGRAAWAEGVGERLVPVELERPWYLVITPPCAVSTARVFADPALTRNTPPMTINDLIREPPSPEVLDVAALLARTRNDCEPVTRALHAEVDAALEWLVRRAGTARMSGTGASVFAPFADAREARAVLATLPERWRGTVSRGANRSPLHVGGRSRHGV